jgi:hypothetical protein
VLSFGSFGVCCVLEDLVLRLLRVTTWFYVRLWTCRDELLFVRLSRFMSLMMYDILICSVENLFDIDSSRPLCILGVCDIIYLPLVFYHVLEMRMRLQPQVKDECSRSGMAIVRYCLLSG